LKETDSKESGEATRGERSISFRKPIGRAGVLKKKRRWVGAVSEGETLKTVEGREKGR